MIFKINFKPGKITTDKAVAVPDNCFVYKQDNKHYPRFKNYFLLKKHNGKIVLTGYRENCSSSDTHEGAIKLLHEFLKNRNNE